MVETQGQRIKNERLARGWTQAELAKRVSRLYGKKVKQQSIDQLEADKVETPLFFGELCQVLEVPAKYLRTGTVEYELGPGERPMFQGFEHTGIEELSRDVPLISAVQAGEADFAEDPFYPGEAEEWLPCPRQHSSKTFALRVDGHSMTAPAGAPRSFPQGINIFVDPELRGGVVAGDFIIAKINGRNAVTFKQLAFEDGRYFLRPLNPSYEPIFEKFSVLGKVIYAGFYL